MGNRAATARGLTLALAPAMLNSSSRVAVSLLLAGALAGCAGQTTDPAGGAETGLQSSCGATAWQQGHSYNAGDVVRFNGSYYVGTNANPGYDPTISTWFWDPHTCSGAPSSPPPASGGSGSFGQIVSSGMFNSMFPSRNGFY